jgi:lipopolysaccharide/colanic/teichoic acid biosynthesis glycosyltransferase
VALHDRFWEAQGLCIVRRGEPIPEMPSARMYLLTDPHRLILMEASIPAFFRRWNQRDIAIFRIGRQVESRVREKVIFSEDRGSVRIAAMRQRAHEPLARIAITSRREHAEFWSSLPEPKDAWRHLRRVIPENRQLLRSIRGQVFNRDDAFELDAFVHGLAALWEKPGEIIKGIERLDSGAWKQESAEVAHAARIVGSVWIGWGRAISADQTIVGPAVLWDEPHSAPAPRHGKGFRRLAPAKWLERPIILRPQPLMRRLVKRTFDIFFALVALTLTLPMYPLVMLAIWLEDGRPFFFGHRREMLRGREFTCWKFRSMRKDAERYKARLRRLNLSNGPHFYMERDPRLTKVGRFMRRFHIDELPQFFNVLAGHMSVVGPRPSPHSENQGCSTWRETRLSVRPGITGLWQVSRTRRLGGDFQEWIRYDVEYVENCGFWLDLRIILRTFTRVFSKP